MKPLTTIFIIFMILSISGFYIVLTNITNLKNQVENLELSLELAGHIDNISTTISLPPNTNLPTSTQTQALNLQSTGGTIVTIPTSIIFQERSSAALTPQSNLTLTIESVSRATDGVVKINLKIFTNEATSYTSVQPKDLFEIIDLSENGTNLKPFSEDGPFNSLPPQSSVSGNIVFKINPTQNTVIFQVGSQNNTKYYEFNFLKKNYKETVIG